MSCFQFKLLLFDFHFRIKRGIDLKTSRTITTPNSAETKEMKQHQRHACVVIFVNNEVGNILVGAGAISRMVHVQNGSKSRKTEKY